MKELLNKMDLTKIVTVILCGTPPIVIAIGLINLVFSNKITNALPEKMYEMYEIFIISGFLVTWLIILAILRYALSKRHNE